MSAVKWMPILIVLLASCTSGNTLKPVKKTDGQITALDKQRSEIKPLRSYKSDIEVVEIEKDTAMDDPLMTSIRSGEYDRVRLAKGAVKPPFVDIVPVFRIQVAASTNPVGARSIAAQARSKTTEPVLIDSSSQYYKIQVGNFRIRGNADLQLSKMKAAGYSAAWVVKGTWKIAEGTVSSGFNDGKYRIQVGSFSELSAAQTVWLKIAKEFEDPVHIVNVDNAYKVVVGQGTSAVQLERLKAKLKAAGFPGFVSNRY